MDLKDGETVPECVARNRADTVAVVGLLAVEKARVEQADARADHSHCHDLVCNGSRQHPVGAPGQSCSCRGRRERDCQEITELRAELAALKADRTCATCQWWTGRHEGQGRHVCLANETTEALFADEVLWTAASFGCKLYLALPTPPTGAER